MITEDQVKVLEQAILVYGPETQLILLMEEMAELTVETSHALRHREHRIAEEMADVVIMLKQLELMLPHLKRSKSQVAEWVDHKITRLEENLKK